jgi:hypothetical protein
MTPTSKRTIALAAGVGCLVMGWAILVRSPALERAPFASDGGMGEDNEKEAGPKKLRRHRFHQPHELPDESLPPPSGHQ